MNKQNWTQKTGIVLILVGIISPFVILGVNMGVDRFATGNAVVGDGSTVLAWLMKLFGGCGSISFVGIITFLIGLWNQTRGTNIPLPQGGFLLPNLLPKKIGPLAINPEGATSEELQELGSAAIMYIGNHGSPAAQNRFMAAVASLADVMPNVKAVMDDGVLVTRIRLFPAAVVPLPPPATGKAV